MLQDLSSRGIKLRASSLTGRPASRRWPTTQERSDAPSHNPPSESRRSGSQSSTDWPVMSPRMSDTRPSGLLKWTAPLVPYGAYPSHRPGAPLSVRRTGFGSSQRCPDPPHDGSRRSFLRPCSGPKMRRAIKASSGVVRVGWFEPLGHSNSPREQERGCALADFEPLFETSWSTMKSAMLVADDGGQCTLRKRLPDGLTPCIE